VEDHAVREAEQEMLSPALGGFEGASVKRPGSPALGSPRARGASLDHRAPERCVETASEAEDRVAFGHPSSLGAAENCRK
jgi:hypothetical protein